jgi:hypothetical protein
MGETHTHQHTIPSSYSAAWLEPITPPGETPAIFRISKDSKKVQRRSPANSFTVNNHYTVRLQDGTRDLSVEHHLGSIENDFQGVLKTIRLKRPLSPLEKAKVCVFTGAMLGRSKQLADLWVRQMREQLEQVKELERIHNLEPVKSQEIEDVIKNLPAQIVVNAIQLFAPNLFRMNLTIYTTDDPVGFITSDAPAVMDNPKKHGLGMVYGQPGLADKDVEITLPLTPEHLALFTRRPDGALYIALKSSSVNEANRRTFFFCNDEFISRTGEMRMEWFEEQKMPPSDLWPTS